VADAANADGAEAGGGQSTRGAAEHSPNFPGPTSGSEPTISEAAEAAEAPGVPGAPTRTPMLQVGSIVKPHGLKGELIVSLTTNRQERVAPGSVLAAADGRELKVVRSSPHRGRFIVAFEGVSGIDQAEAMRGTQLFALPLEDPDALWVHELIGAQVDLLVLDGGALIPLRFVVGNEPGVRVTVEVPDGLFDLA
jgi:16S rRNA processing protein RimM